MEDRKQKQTFLRKEIMEGGYDINKFMEFCNSLKPDGGTNIDCWSINELKDIVKNFKNGNKNESKNAEDIILNENITQSSTKLDMHEQKVESNRKITTSQDLSDSHIQSLSKISGDENRTEEEKKNAKIQTKLKKEKEKEILDKKDKKEDESLKLIEEKEKMDYSKVIKCQKAQPVFDQSINEIEISLKDFEIKQGGLFSFSYVIYRIITNPFKWEVKRRFSDLYWLRDTLIRLYPHLIIPPIHSKKKKKYGTIFYCKKNEFFGKIFKQFD